MSNTLTVDVLLAGAAVIVLARAGGWLLGRAGQPQVIGELLVGIVLGPTVLSGRIGHAIVPEATRSALSLLGTVGVILVTLFIALRLAPGRRELTTAGRLAAGSVLVPLAAGIAVGLALAGRYRPTGVGEPAFILFVGAAIATTAFPVLARILAERGWETLELGRLALGAAAIGDVVTWLLVTVCLVLAGAEGAHPARLLALIPFAAVLVGIRVSAARGAGARILERGAAAPQLELALLIAGAVAAAAATDWMGLQTIAGAFAFGLALPRGPARQVADRVAPSVEPIVAVVLLPIYFVINGLRVDLSSIGLVGLVSLGLIAVAAVGGKFLGVGLAARLSGLQWRAALSLGALLNTRGLTELVVLSVGLQEGLISTQLFSLMVVMAVGTTLLTAPLLALLRPRPDDLGARPEQPPALRV